MYPPALHLERIKDMKMMWKIKVTSGRLGESSDGHAPTLVNAGRKFFYTIKGWLWDQRVAHCTKYPRIFIIGIRCIMEEYWIFPWVVGYGLTKNRMHSQLTLCTMVTCQSISFSWHIVARFTNRGNYQERLETAGALHKIVLTREHRYKQGLFGLSSSVTNTDTPSVHE
jgi:hypothetical protein